jgi:predicted PurR-regulated permease PerM
MTSYKNTSQTTINMLGLIALVFILYILKTLIMPLIIAMILAIMVYPIQRFLERRWCFNRLLATISSISIIFFITSVFLIIVYWQLYEITNNKEDYTVKITEMYYKSISYLENIFNISERNSLINTDLKIENLLKGNFDKIGELISKSGSLFSDLILIPIYLFFFLYYRRFFREFLYKVFRKKSKSFLNSLIRKIYHIQQNYLVGLIKVIFIVGALNTLGLVALGIDNAIFFGFLAAFLLIIPYVGIIIGAAIPAIIALATKDSAFYALGVIAIFSFIQFLEGNFITPKITGSKVSVNAFVAIFSLIAFSMLWGIMGMIVALPVVATLKIIFDNTPEYHAYGFIIGEPINKHFESIAKTRLKHWKKIRKENH